MYVGQGCANNFLKATKKRVSKTKMWKKVCVEMCWKELEKWTKNYCVGCEDFDLWAMANQAMTLVRSINSGWKQAIGQVLTNNGDRAHVLKKKKIITKLDWYSCLSLYLWQASINQWYTEFYMYDPPHLLKLVRNQENYIIQWG